MSNGFGTNIAAVKVTGRLNDTARSQQTVMERLSSGMRINRASDDAAGLSIAMSLRADNRIYSQALRNVSDGISAINIATAAIAQLTNIVTRQVELAEQAANGSYSAKQRAALDKEALALTDEYNRIGATVTFNGINVLTTATTIQAGMESASLLSINAGSIIADEIGTGSFATPTTVSSSSSVSRQIESIDLNGDGYDDLVTGNWTDSDISVMLSNGDGTFATTQYNVGGNASIIKFVDLNNDGNEDVVTRGYDGVNTSVAVLLGNGNGTFKAANHYSASGAVFYDFELADFNSDGNLDFIGSHSTLGTGIAVLLGRGDGSFGSLSMIGSYRAGVFHAGDFNGDSKMDFVAVDYSVNNARIFYGNGDATFSVQSPGINSYAEVFDINRDGYSDIVRFNTTSSLGILYGSQSGTFTTGASISLSNALMYNIKRLDLNNDGYNDLVTFSDTSTTANVIYGNADGSFSTAQAFTVQSNTYDVTAGDVVGDGSRDLIFTSLNALGVQIYEQRGVRTVNQAHVNLLSMIDARTSLDQLRTQLQNLSKQAALIGAQESRLSSVTNVLQAIKENYSLAESRITDADIAQESATLIRQTILSQIGSAIMAQAKNNSNYLLDILKNS